MKKTFIMIAALGFLTACGGDAEKKEEKNTATEQKVEESSPLKDKAMALIANSDCATCHKIDEKLIGPAWRDVANKYAGQDTAVKYIAHKIINGGAGVWGQVPMAPHPTMSQEDAETLANYVMTLKNQ